MPFLPLKDINPISITPHQTYIFIALNIIVFLFNNTIFNVDPDLLYDSYATIPSQLFGNTEPKGEIPELFTLLTSAFLHVNFIHLGVNILFFYLFADNLENCFSVVGFFCFCIAAALFSSYCQALTDKTSDIPTIGFSGVVYACIGAYIMLYPQAKIEFLTPFEWVFWYRMNYTFTLPAWVILPLYPLTDFVSFYHNDISQLKIAHIAHLSGFLFGLCVARFLKKYETDYNIRLFSKVKRPHIIKTRADEILENHYRRETEKNKK